MRDKKRLFNHYKGIDSCRDSFAHFAQLDCAKCAISSLFMLKFYLFNQLPKKSKDLVKDYSFKIKSFLLY